MTWKLNRFFGIMTSPQSGNSSQFQPIPEPSGPSPSSSSTLTYSVDSAIDHVGLGVFQYIMLLFAGLSWTAESMEMLLLSFIKQPLQCAWGITDSQAALITTFVGVGMLTGATFWGVFADKYGRRTSFVISTLFLFVMGVMSGLSANYTMMLISRGLVGFGVGGVPVSFSLLMEFLPSAQRGSWGMSLALFWAIGAMFESVVAMFVLPTLGWRWLIIISTFPLLVVLIFAFWLSESPRWLAARGKEEKAVNVLAQIARINGNTLPEGRLDISFAMKEELENNHGYNASYESQADVENPNNDPLSAEASEPQQSTQQQTLRRQLAQQNEQIENDASSDPFSSRDALVAAQLSPISADYTTSEDIASDAVAPVPSPRENRGEAHDTELPGSSNNQSDIDINRNEGTGQNEQAIDEGWSESKRIPRRRKGGIKELLKPGARGLAVKIGAVWFVCAFVYYGLVMLQPEIIAAENAGQRCKYAEKECASSTNNSTCLAQPICSWAVVTKESSETCIPTGSIEDHEESEEDERKSVCARRLTRDDFISTLWASTGEMPGVLIAFVLVDVIGRRPLLGYYFVAMAVSFALLIRCTSRLFETGNFFVSRGAASGAFQAMFLLTNEVYPSSIRATAMGIASSISRIGLLATPFVAQYLFNINELAALLIYSLLSAVCLIAIILLPIETTGRPLVSSMDELIAAMQDARLRANENVVSFSNDPSVHRIVRLFRWRARLDGMIVK